VVITRKSLDLAKCRRESCYLGPKTCYFAPSGQTRDADAGEALGDVAAIDKAKASRRQRQVGRAADARGPRRS